MTKLIIFCENKDAVKQDNLPLSQSNFQMGILTVEIIRLLSEDVFFSG